MFSTDTLIHPLFFNNSIKLPEKFTYPFQYTPHILCKIASEKVQFYLERQSDIKHDFNVLGKMFGILVVKTSNNKIAYLVAFSGKIDEKTKLKGFVPPVFDTLNPNSFYKKGEEKLNNLTLQINQLENSAEFLNIEKTITETKNELKKELELLKATASTAKKQRKIKRQQAIGLLSEQKMKELTIELNKQSEEHHYKIKDFKKYSTFKISELEKQLQPLIDLKTERKQLSASLQKQLHNSYRLLNANKETKSLTSIFSTTPPAGSGECSAPKLLQFAYKNNLEPIAMAEFWWGKQPTSQVRAHKQFYPSCKSRCKPILEFMMQGLSVDENPIKNRANIKLEIVFEDDYLLVINKPYDFLSVSGNQIKDSVFTRIQEYLPNATGALLVHRLDMATSGLLLIAKTAQIHKDLQQQFINRTVQKRYVAVLEGTLPKKSGTISLPLRSDYHNRPCQLVCFNSGKHSITEYEVIEEKNGKTKVFLYPKTGRTHQLRVHTAHHLGLNIPILGDDLYGTKNKRLYLHAEKLIFQHPVTKKRIEVTSKAEF